MLIFEHVSFVGAQRDILQDVSLTVNEADFAVISGPSGSGKSTLLKLCAFLISPSAGRILFHDRDLTAHEPTELRKQIGYCFQTPHLFGMTVLENLAFPYQIRRQTPDRERIQTLFDRFNLSVGLLNANVQRLSGGERQRIALIRSLLFQPEVLLLDEVTASLDLENTEAVEGAVAQLNREGMTILWVSHQPDRLGGLANRSIRITDGRLAELEV